MHIAKPCPRPKNPAMPCESSSDEVLTGLILLEPAPNEPIYPGSGIRTFYEMNRV